MKKVEIIYDTSKWVVEGAVNEFISTHNVLDIQFRMTGENQVRTVYAAMIIYEED